MKSWSSGAGRWIEVEEVPSNATGKGKPKFKAQWVKLPASWVTALRQTKSAATKQLALEILHEGFRRKHTGGKIVLSSAMTGMSQATRHRAARELVHLGLIELETDARQATRVVRVHA